MSTIFMIFALLLWASASPTLQNTYELQESKRYSIYAALAFCPASCLELWSCTSSKQLQDSLIEVQVIDSNMTKAYGYAGYNPVTKQVIISWRGSDNTINWIQDFTFAKIPYHACLGCEIHSGFYFDFLSLRNKLYDKVERLMQRHTISSVVLTGHSLGAALSQIAALELRLRWSNIKLKLHNFGCPRVGNKALALFTMKKLEEIYRVVHNRDLVPHVPFEAMGFHHPAREVLFSEDMKSYTVCNQSGQDSSCSNKFFPQFNPNDHDFYFTHISHVSC